MMKALTDYDVDSLAAELAGWGCKPSQALRLLRHFYQHDGDVDFAEVELGKELEGKIRDQIAIRQSHVALRTQARDGTVKLLVELTRGGAVETVLMPSHRAGRAAGCVSSQIGCAMGCDFCASTRRGLERNLEAGEIVEQFLHLRREARAAGRRLQTLVFMGMGEPMHNLPNVLAAIQRIAGDNLGHLGGKQITVSTVGIVPGIAKLAESGLGVHLAISLHAADDELRARIVPTGKRYRVAEIVQAAKDFQERARRMVTFEYCLLRDVNDSDEQAGKLAELLRGFRAHVNLIPYNHIGAGVSGVIYQRPDDARMKHFADLLRDGGVVTHFRDRRGDDVNAACGQLREMAAHK